MRDNGGSPAFRRAVESAAMGSEEHSERGPLPPRRRRPRYPGTHPRRFEHRYKELAPDAHPEMHEHVRAQGRTPAGTHVPVLLDEVMAALNPRPGDVVVDCTIGYGGHAEAFLRRIAPGGRLIGLDLDGPQLARTGQRLANALDRPVALVLPGDVPSRRQPPATLRLYHRHFGGIGRVLGEEGISGFDIVFADLGASSMQIDDPARGFSFRQDGPLDMRMDLRRPHTAANLLASLDRETLTLALRRLADEPAADRIAGLIVDRRDRQPIRRTRELVRLVFEAKGISMRQWRRRPESRPGDLHPAARTFQALRILVNDELSGLEQLLRQAPYCLRPGGRLGIISFHSGEEDRVAAALEAGRLAGLYEHVCEHPITPGAAEVSSNPRARSARLRWAITGCRNGS